MKSSYYTGKTPENITKEWLELHQAATAKLINDAAKTFKAWKQAQRKTIGYRTLEQ